MRPHWIPFVLAVVAAARCSSPSTPQPPAGGPGSAGAMRSHTPLGSSVQLAIANETNAGVSLAASGTLVVAVWTASNGQRTNIHAAVSHDGAATFGAPVRVNDRDGDARFSGEQAPRVAIGRDIAVVWPSRENG